MERTNCRVASCVAHLVEIKLVLNSNLDLNEKKKNKFKLCYPPGRAGFNSIYSAGLSAQEIEQTQRRKRRREKTIFRCIREGLKNASQGIFFFSFLKGGGAKYLKMFQFSKSVFFRCAFFCEVYLAYASSKFCKFISRQPQ